MTLSPPLSPKQSRIEQSRELYRYLDPATFPHNANGKVPSKAEGVLVAQLQLLTWRLDARKAVTTVVDQGFTSSFAAGLKSQHLSDPTVCDDPADMAWSADLCIDANQSVCPNTLQLLPSDDGSPVFFEVVDLLEDSRFCNFPVVTEHPHLRYYYGVPLFTKRGIAIGALCVCDDVPRAAMKESERKFIQSVAETIMSHLSLLRDRKERSRATKMSKCLNAFVDPTTYDATSKSPEKPAKRYHQNDPSQSPKLTEERFSNSHDPHRASENDSSLIKLTTSEDDTAQNSESYTHHPTYAPLDNITDKPAVGSRPDTENHEHIFQNAVRLLRRSLDIEHGGGVLFIDTAAALRTDFPFERKSDAGRPGTSRAQSQSDIETIGDGSVLKRIRLRGTASSAEFAEVIASSHVRPQCMSSKENTLSSDWEPFHPITVNKLSKLVKRYARGKIWHFKVNGQLSSESSDEFDTIPQHDDGKLEAGLKAQEEANMLRRHFPGAFQIMLIPIFDPQTFRWVAYFAYTTSRFRTFSYQIDFLYSLAFCNCIAIAKARLAAVASDYQKGNFIGSISHELRTPLHGILASCEFLRETDQTTFQQSLVGTVESCAKTLSDTIGMVLDYSKMSSFEREKRNPQRANTSDAPEMQHITGPDADHSHEAKPGSRSQFSSVYKPVDLAAITEEVIEGCRAGHMYKKMPTLDLVDIDSMSSVTSDRAQSVNVRHDSRNGGEDAAEEDLEIILQIAPGNWLFLTQPGPFRRVVMNLVGNALKYTLKGWVKVVLHVVENFDESMRVPVDTQSSGTAIRIVQLVVSDTGKGISPEFLKSKLFVPFAQETTLSSGTGLGLSLVRSIIRMFGGDIDVRSKLGKGTAVTVEIPMECAETMSLNVSNNAPGSNGTDMQHSQDHIIEIVREKAQGLRIVSFFSEKTNPGQRAVGHAAIQYCVSWFGMKTAQMLGSNADIVITDERDMSPLLEQVTGVTDPLDCPAVVVFYSSTPWHPKLHRYAHNAIVEFVCKPIGPHRLARALSVCIDRLRRKSRIGSNLSNEHAQFKHDDLEVTERADAEIIETKDIGSHVRPREEVEDDNDGVCIHPNKRNRLNRYSGTDRLENKDTGSYLLPLEALQRSSLPSNPSDPENLTSTASKALVSDKYDQNTLTEPHLGNHSEAATRLPEQSFQPSIMIVDDNIVNRKLLQAFLRKKSYTTVAIATNGQEAVETFRKLFVTNPVNVILMDISMPVLDGFEATKQIREIESPVAADSDIYMSDNDRIGRQHALIVALTGLASEIDQTKALSAGADMYMSKPVSLKEIDRVLEDWKKSHLQYASERA